MTACAMHAGIKTRSDVLKMGIGKYNEECRSIVMRCGCRCMHVCSTVCAEHVIFPQEAFQQHGRQSGKSVLSRPDSLKSHRGLRAPCAETGTPRSGRRRCGARGAGLTSRTTTRRWTPPSWRASGGSLRSCTRRASSTAASRRELTAQPSTHAAGSLPSVPVASMHQQAMACFALHR